MFKTKPVILFSALLTLGCVTAAGQAGSACACSDTGGGYVYTPPLPPPPVVRTPVRTTSIPSTTAGAVASTGASTATKVLGAAGTVVGAAIVLKHLFGSSPSEPAPVVDAGPTPEQLAAQQQQLYNNEAADILQQANSAAGDGDPNAAAPETDPGSQVSNLLGDSPAPDATSAVNSLLDDSDSINTSTAGEVADLLGGIPVDDSSSVFSSVMPTDPNMASALNASQAPAVPSSDIAAAQEQVDVPNPSPSVLSNLKDGLQDAISNVKGTLANAQATLSSVMNSPSGQMFSAADGLLNGDAPDLLATDTPEQMADKVYAQAIVGFMKFNGPLWVGIKDYNYALIDKGMSQLGFATGTPAQ